MRRNCVSYGLFRVCSCSFIDRWYCCKVIPVFWDYGFTQRIQTELYLVLRWLFIRATYLYVCYVGKYKRFMESHNARKGYILRSECIFLQIWSKPVAIFFSMVW